MKYQVTKLNAIKGHRDPKYYHIVHPLCIPLAVDTFAFAGRGDLTIKVSWWVGEFDAQT